MITAGPLVTAGIAVGMTVTGVRVARTGIRREFGRGLDIGSGCQSSRLADRCWDALNRQGSGTLLADRKGAQ